MGFSSNAFQRDIPLINILNISFYNVHMLLRVVCLCFLLQVWSGLRVALGRDTDGINAKGGYINNNNNTNAWKFVVADNKPITALSELSDGVFSLRLSAARSDCAAGTGFVLGTLPSMDECHAAEIFISFLLQGTWGLTIGHAPRHYLPNPPLAQ